MLVSQASIASSNPSPNISFEFTNNSVQITNDDETPQELWNKAIGSFQFEILKGRKLTEIDITIIESIEANRHDTEVTYIQYNERIRIKILPKSVINTDYVKLDLMKTVESFELND